MVQTMSERAKRIFPPAAGRVTDLGVVKAEGTYLYTEDGKKYLDFASGIAVCNLGHNHPQVIQAVKEQLDKMIHVGHNVVWYEPYISLGEKLVQLSGGDTMVYFSNSGAEANEGAVKLAKYVSGRPALIAFRGGFHGRTLGTLSLTTSGAAKRKNYEALLPSVHFAEYPYCYRCPFGQEEGKCGLECLQYLEEKVFKLEVAPERVAAMIIEPVAGEGGYIVPPLEFIQELRSLCDRHGIYLIFDEIQTGIGRTGKIFAAEHFGITPDITTLGKAIGGGFPLSAVVAKREIMEKWDAGAHGGTFGGNPVACAAALLILKLLEEGYLDNAARMGQYFKDKLNKLQAKYSLIGDVRGLGLMIGVEFVRGDKKPALDVAKQIQSHCLEHQLVLLTCGPDNNIIRFIAPTTVTHDEIDSALAVVEEGIAKCI
ncbi:MAG: aspartate aminotransferase family protein [bacterium]|jgi:4-aminobutyrate aminotransferase